MKLSQDYAHPAEGELLVAALADETYAVLRRDGDILVEVLSGDTVAPVEIVAAEHLEAWPFGQTVIEVGDEVMVDMPAVPRSTRELQFDQGRVLHTHGSEAWVRLIGGGSIVVPMGRLKLLD